MLPMHRFACRRTAVAAGFPDTSDARLGMGPSDRLALACSPWRAASQTGAFAVKILLVCLTTARGTT